MINTFVPLFLNQFYIFCDSNSWARMQSLLNRFSLVWGQNLFPFLVLLVLFFSLFVRKIVHLDQLGRTLTYQGLIPHRFWMSAKIEHEWIDCETNPSNTRVRSRVCDFVDLAMWELIFSVLKSEWFCVFGSNKNWVLLKFSCSYLFLMISMIWAFS